MLDIDLNNQQKNIMTSHKKSNKEEIDSNVSTLSFKKIDYKIHLTNKLDFKNAFQTN